MYITSEDAGSCTAKDTHSQAVEELPASHPQVLALQLPHPFPHSGCFPAMATSTKTKSKTACGRGPPRTASTSSFAWMVTA